MPKSQSQIRLIGVLGAVLGGVVYMQRETYFGGAEDAAPIPLTVALPGGPLSAPAESLQEVPTEVLAPPIDLKHLIGISPFKQSGELRLLFEPEFGAPQPLAEGDADTPHFVSQATTDSTSASEDDSAAVPPVTRSMPQPQVEAVFTDRSGRWHAIVDSRRVGVGDVLVAAETGEPYAEILAIDAAGVDIRLLDEEELAAIDSIN